MYPAAPDIRVDGRSVGPRAGAGGRRQPGHRAVAVLAGRVAITVVQPARFTVLPGRPAVRTVLEHALERLDEAYERARRSAITPIMAR